MQTGHIKDYIERIGKQQKTMGEHACPEFSIEHLAQAFLDAIQTVTGKKK